MNKIIVDNNKLLSYSDKYIDIKNNIIIFKQDSDYTIEYNNCTSINIKFILNKKVSIHIFEKSINNNITINNTYNLEENSFLSLSKFYVNNNTNEKSIINLNGEKANMNYYFSNICISNENYKIIINHNVKNTISNVQNRLLVLNNSNLNMDIDSNVGKKEIKCKLNQDTKVIFMKENNVTIKPNMFIECDDVEAKHSSVIGRFNEQEIFYLMSRGISYDSSIKLLIKGYIFSNLKINELDQNKILEIINNIIWGGTNE